MSAASLPILTVFVAVFVALVYALRTLDRKRKAVSARIHSIHRSRNPSKQAHSASADIRKNQSNSKLFGTVVARLNILIYKSSLGITLKQFVVTTIFFAAVTNIVTLSTGMSLITVTIITLLFISSPIIYLYYKSAKADIAMLKQLPDGLDTIVRSIKTGLPISDAIKTIAESKTQPMSRIFSDIYDNLQIGRNIDEAFYAAIEKFPLPELNFLAISINIQKETGGNMSEIISNLSDIMRQRDRLKSKIRAMSSEARASAMIIGSLPFVMSIIIWFVNPEYISILWLDSRGHLLAAIGLTSMSVGSLIIWRMISFRI